MLITNRASSLETMAITLKEAFSNAEAIWIASGYISHEACELLGLKRLAGMVPVHITAGRALPEGLPHETLKYLHDLDHIAQKHGGGVRAANPPCHAKIFCVQQATTIQTWVGSSNLTLNGIQHWVEANVAVFDTAAAQSVLSEAKDTWKKGAKLALVQGVSQRGMRRPEAAEGGISQASSILTAQEMPETAPSLVLSLVGRKGEVQERSGLNWWNGGGRKRDPNEAYIALPAAKLGEAEQVFGSTGIKTIFRAIMHDGLEMLMCLEGTNNNKNKGITYAKQISSYGTKTEFGKWILRHILRKPNGKLVTRIDLDDYGRTDITFKRIGTDQDGRAIVFIDFLP